MIYSDLTHGGSIFSQWGHSMFSDWGGGMMSGWGGMFMFPLIPIIFFGLIIWLVIYLVRGTGGSGVVVERETPLEILQARFARGEIDQAEYEKRLAVLNSRPGESR